MINNNTLDINSEISDFNDEIYDSYINVQCKNELEKINCNYNNYNRICNEKCAICHDMFLENLGENIVKTNCEHIYHENCINMWFSSSKEESCPICRKKLFCEYNVKPDLLFQHNRFCDVKKIKFTVCSNIDYSCDMCGICVNFRRYHLKNKNYDLCLKCYQYMYNAYTKKIKIPVNFFFIIDKKFKPQNYVYYGPVKYNLTIEFEQLSLVSFVINNHIIKTKDSIELYDCILDNVKLQSKFIKINNCKIGTNVQYETKRLIIDNKEHNFENISIIETILTYKNYLLDNKNIIFFQILLVLFRVIHIASIIGGISFLLYCVYSIIKIVIFI